jgi:hypothetical protein
MTSLPMPSPGITAILCFAMGFSRPLGDCEMVMRTIAEAPVRSNAGLAGLAGILAAGWCCGSAHRPGRRFRVF